MLQKIKITEHIIICELLGEQVRTYAPYNKKNLLQKFSIIFKKYDYIITIGNVKMREK